MGPEHLMTDAQTKVLNILQGQPTPLSSADLVTLSGLTRIEVLKGLNDLQSTHAITKNNQGYQLVATIKSLPPLPDAETKLLLLQALALGGDPRLQRHFVELQHFVKEALHATA